MFYAGEALLLTKNVRVKTHSGFISKFGEHFIKTNTFPKEIGKELRKVFDKRLIGDYDYFESITNIDAKEILDTGKDFVKNLKEYLVRNKFI